MNDNEEIIIETSANIDTIYQQDKALIDTMIATAKAYPRNIKRAVDNAIVIVTMDKETAATCTYSLPRGGKPITGPSVHLARILAQCWGNMRIETKVISTEDRTQTSQGIAFDIEANLAIKVEVKRSIMTRSGRMNDDMIVVTGNAGNAIALRNAILSVIPGSIVKKVHGEAKAAMIGDVSDKTKLIARRKQIFDALKDTYNVSEKEILSAIGKAALDHVTADDLVTLIGVGTAIKDGDTTVEYAFKGGNTNAKTAEDVEAKKEDMKNNNSQEPAPTLL